MKKFQEWLTKISDAMLNCKPLMILQGAFQMILPFTIIGAIGSLINGLPFEAYQDFIAKIGLKSVLSLPYDCTFGYFSLYLAFAVGYQYMTKKGMKKNAIISGLMSIFSLLIVTPTEQFATYIGTVGTFGAMIVAYLTASSMHFIYNRNWTIKMPAGVPQGVANSFMALVPGFIIAAVMVLIRFIFALTPWGDLQSALFTLVRAPLMAIGCNVFGEVMFYLVSVILWFFGVHGGMATAPIYMALFINNQAENLAAFQANQTPPNMVVGLGINYSILAVVLSILIFSKNKGARSIAKISFLPALFEIQEPVSFGLPIIMNPIFFIPYIICGTTPILGTRLLQMAGFLGNSNCIAQNQAVLSVVSSFLNYGWKGIVVSIVFTIIAIFIFAPFVRMNDARLAKEAAKETEDKQ